MRYPIEVSHGTLKPDDVIPAIAEALAQAISDGITPGETEHQHRAVIQHVCTGSGQSETVIPEEFPKHVRSQHPETQTWMLDVLEELAEHHQWRVLFDENDPTAVYLHPVHTLAEVAEMYADAITEHTRPIPCEEAQTFVQINPPDTYSRYTLDEITQDHLYNAHPQSPYHQPGDLDLRTPSDGIMQLCADAIRAHAYWLRYVEDDQTHSANDDDLHDSTMHYLQGINPYTHCHLEHATKYPHVMLPLLDDVRKWNPEDNMQQNLHTAYAEHCREIAQAMAEMITAAREEINQ